MLKTVSGMLDMAIMIAHWFGHGNHQESKTSNRQVIRIKEPEQRGKEFLT